MAFQPRLMRCLEDGGREKAGGERSGSAELCLPFAVI